MPHECKYEDRVIEMSENIKVLVTEFKHMNGTLKDYAVKQVLHEDESTGYRKKIDTVWSGIHFTKYLILLLIGSGIAYKIVEKLITNG